MGRDRSKSMRLIDGKVQKIQDEIDKLTKKQKERAAIPTDS